MPPKIRYPLLIPAVILSSLLCGPHAFGATPQPQEQAKKARFTVQSIADGVYAVIAARDGNTGFVVGDDGVAVIDTLTSSDAARELLTEIRKVTSMPVRFVVNTHYHLDHTGGNAVFAAEGATIVAHRNVRTWTRTENLKFFGPSPKPEQKAMVERIALPTLVYDDGIELFLGSRRLVVRHFPGHTGGDSIVVVPDGSHGGVVFCGDLLWKTHLPNLIDASTGLWIGTLAEFAIVYAGSTFVPGHGEVAETADVGVFRNYLVTLWEAVAKAQAAGKSGDALVDAVLPGLKEKYGEWGFFTNFAKSNILQAGEELSGKKRLPGSRRGSAP
ncbi:MAG: MBL fold metallo-hydrolase [Acidobacteriia bacterium]|nr:MBL fold metallo-hydrolase [Terriglobia bacterium]